jgi:hypothetical protein
MRLIVFLLICVVTLNACSFFDGEKVEIRVNALSTSPPRSFKNVSVISGGDRFTWGQLQSGETVHVTLRPGKTSDAQVTLIYTASDEKQRVWEGDHLAPDRSHQVVVEIDAQGHARGRSCAAPCDF